MTAEEEALERRWMDGYFIHPDDEGIDAVFAQLDAYYDSMPSLRPSSLPYFSQSLS
jgi:hypothetical protein